jgi:hypothetical protein
MSPVISGLSGYFGSNGASNAQVAGNNAAIGTEQNLIPALTNVYGAQRTAGNGAFSPLTASLGLNGGAPDYSAFDHSPGYQFSVQQGQQAINRQAAATGGAYSSSTLGAIGNYTQGMASENYNNYVNQLMGLAGYGASGNANLGQNLYGVGANIAQTQSASGNARANGAAGAANGIGSAASGLPWGQIVSGIGSMFNNSGSSGTSTIPGADTNYGGTYDPYAGMDTGNLGNLSGLDSFGSGADSSGFNDPNGGFNSYDPNGAFSGNNGGF